MATTSKRRKRSRRQLTPAQLKQLERAQQEALPSVRSLVRFIAQHRLVLRNFAPQVIRNSRSREDAIIRWDRHIVVITDAAGRSVTACDVSAIIHQLRWVNDIVRKYEKQQGQPGVSVSNETLGLYKPRSYS